MFEEMFENDKILIRKIGNNSIMAVADFDGYYASQTLIVALPYWEVENVAKLKLKKDQIEESKEFKIGYVLSILNSKPIRNYYDSAIGDGLSVVPSHIQQIPIPEATMDVQDKLSHLALSNTTMVLEREKILPLMDFKRLISTKTQTLTDDFYNYLKRVLPEDIIIDPTFVSTITSKSIQLDEIEEEAEYLALLLSYKVRNTSEYAKAKILIRFPTITRTFLREILKEKRGPLGGGNVLSKVHALKIPRFDQDELVNNATIDDMVNLYNGYSDRLNLLNEKIKNTDDEMDSIVTDLYHLND